MQKISVEFRITDQIRILHARMLRSAIHYPALPVLLVVVPVATVARYDLLPVVATSTVASAWREYM